MMRQIPVEPKHDRSEGQLDSVKVSVVKVDGSSPREVGATMMVTEVVATGTIGGGAMEYKAIEIARHCLTQEKAKKQHECEHGALLSSVLLNPKNDQCCGGKVDLMYELMRSDSTDDLATMLSDLNAKQKVFCELTLARRMGDKNQYDQVSKVIVMPDQVFSFVDGKLQTDKKNIKTITSMAEAIVLAQEKVSTTEQAHNTDFLLNTAAGLAWVGQFSRACDFNISVYGAGHVGKALVHILSMHDCRVRWIDSRKEVLREFEYQNIEQIHDNSPARTVSDAPANSLYLVMTHSHELDFELCDHILARDDVCYLGLIGSTGKAQHFRNKFKQQGLSDLELTALVCPIGIEGIENKSASAIAISVAAQCQRVYEQRFLKD